MFFDPINFKKLPFVDFWFNVQGASIITSETIKIVISNYISASAFFYYY